MIIYTNYEAFAAAIQPLLPNQAPAQEEELRLYRGNSSIPDDVLGAVLLPYIGNANWATLNKDAHAWYQKSQEDIQSKLQKNQLFKALFSHSVDSTLPPSQFFEKLHKSQQLAWKLLRKEDVAQEIREQFNGINKARSYEWFETNLNEFTKKLVASDLPSPPRILNHIKACKIFILIFRIIIVMLTVSIIASLMLIYPS